MSGELEKYRKEIAEIDRQIIELANGRLQKAEKIGEIKRQRNLPIINLSVEAEVIDRSVKLARKIGLDEAFALKLINLLIDEAVNVQGTERYQTNRYGDQELKRRVAILGGTGKMGRWFAKFLKEKGFNVAIHSRSPEKAAKVAETLHVNSFTSLDAVRDVDMVIVSTSLDSTAETVREVSKKMRPNAIIFDIASVKGNVIEALKEARNLGLRAISVHPMFGPGASSLRGKHVILVPVDDDQKLVDEMMDLFRGAEIQVVSSGEAHDTLVALTLSLPHFLNIVFGKAVSGEDIMKLTKFAGTTFALQLLIAEAVYSEDPELYYYMQSQNAVFTDILNASLKSLRDTASIIKKKDRKTFIKDFNEVRAALARDPNFSKAYNRFYKVYEDIISKKTQ